MTDLQILTIAISAVIAVAGPTSAAVWSNARVADVSKCIDDTNANLGSRIDKLDKKIDTLEQSLKAHIDNAFEHMKLLLELHEAKHHRN